MENGDPACFWLNDDFSHLKELSLRSQLETIFGEFQAEQYLNPSIQEKRMQNIPANISTKVGPIGALDLWESLRLQSKDKQSKVDYGSQLVPIITPKPQRSTQTRKVMAYSHKLHLMYKVAQLNEVHSSKLIKGVDLPQITGSWNVNRLENEYANFFTPKKSDITLPEIKSISVVCGDQNCRPFVANSDMKHVVDIENKPRQISFLTEKDATVCGEFRRRMMKSRGIDSSVGITNASHSYQSAQYAGVPSERKTKNEFKNKDDRKSQAGLKSSNTWEPLTINAVVECMDLFSQRKRNAFTR